MSATVASQRGPSPAGPDVSSRRLTERVFRIRESGIIVVLLVFVIVTASIQPRFLNSQNVQFVLINTTVFALLALGETMVVVSRNVDLSIGSVLGLSAFLSARLFSQVHGIPIPLVFLVGLGIGLACGMANGLMVSVGRVPSLVVTLKLWFADGTNYPGQDDIRARQDRLAENLAAIYARLGPGQRMLLEYKLFEPSFYTTDVPDWGTSLLHCTALGPKAAVVVDTGHHAPGVNIEFIVAVLLRAGRLGGFDFNSRFYADDDLMVGAADPFQLFRILHEVVRADALRPAAGVAFMLDQCHNIEPKIPAQIRSVLNVQEATAKALLVDAPALAAAQQAGDVLGANAVLMDAYDTDVRPLLAELRAEMGLDPDPVAAYYRSGYADRIVADRIGGTPASWTS
jgi:hypothetical protein